MTHVESFGDGSMNHIYHEDSVAGCAERMRVGIINRGKLCHVLRGDAILCRRSFLSSTYP
jgi:hypothetical protein